MLAQGLPAAIEHGGRKYPVRLPYDAVLRVSALMGDKLYTPTEQTEIAIDIFVGRKARRLPIAEKAALLDVIVKRFITSGKSADDSAPRVFDFEQDADYIIAAFWQAYKIDLISMRGRLDWRIFIALFRGLPDGTKIREIMDIRSRPIPIATKNNQEEIRALQKAKAFYALKIDPEEAEKTFQAALDKFAAKF